MLQEYSDKSALVPTPQAIRPRLDDRFLINLKGKDFVTYAGLLDLAHQQGLARLEVELVQHPNVENGNEAICRAIAESSSGQIFSDWGDASPTNTNKMISAHLIRMASTRAKARALRDLTNIGITALEELGGEVDAFAGSNSGTSFASGNGSGNGNGNGSGASRQPRKTTKASTQAVPAQQPQLQPQQPAPSKASQNTNGNGNNGSNGNGQHGGITEPQMRAIMSLAHRKGFTEDDIEAQAMEAFGLNLNALSVKDASALIVQLQQ
ncbi:hypothetical protein SAMN06295888_1681 [Desulfonatronum zhilinae]|nr:hypothetical protein SAMN06295888_1681 [Desulfonatronum zhilinae]